VVSIHTTVIIRDAVSRSDVSARYIAKICPPASGRNPALIGYLTDTRTAAGRENPGLGLSAVPS